MTSAPFGGHFYLLFKYLHKMQTPHIPNEISFSDLQSFLKNAPNDGNDSHSDETISAYEERIVQQADEIWGVVENYGDQALEKTLREEGLERRCASVRAIGVRPDTQELLVGKEEIVFEKLEAAGREAIEEDGADVLILGSTTMHQSHAFLQERMPVPVINPGVVAFKLCEMFLDLGLSHSKTAYPNPEKTNDYVFESVGTVF